MNVFDVDIDRFVEVAKGHIDQKKKKIGLLGHEKIFFCQLFFKCSMICGRNRAGTKINSQVSVKKMYAVSINVRNLKWKRIHHINIG